MAKEILAIPEEDLAWFCNVLEAGLEANDEEGAMDVARDYLTDWIQECREYLTPDEDDEEEAH